MLNEITTVTLDTIREAAAAGESITIIINGQFYDLDTTAGTDPEQAFIEGLQLASAVIEDRRSRQNSVFEGLQLCCGKKFTKKAIVANDTRNAEIKEAAAFIEQLITQTDTRRYYRAELKNNKLWKL